MLTHMSRLAHTDSLCMYVSFSCPSGVADKREKTPRRRGILGLFYPERVCFCAFTLLRRPSARWKVVLDAFGPRRPGRTHRLRHDLFLPGARVLAAISSLDHATSSSPGRM